MAAVAGWDQDCAGCGVRVDGAVLEGGKGGGLV